MSFEDVHSPKRVRDNRPKSFAGIETRANPQSKTSFWPGSEKRGRLSKGSGLEFPRLLALVPDNPAIHRVEGIPQTTCPAYVKPISGGYRSPSRKAKAKGGFPEARTARNESRLACSRDGSRDLRGRGKRANADGGPMLP